MQAAHNNRMSIGSIEAKRGCALFLRSKEEDKQDENYVACIDAEPGTGCGSGSQTLLRGQRDGKRTL